MGKHNRTPSSHRKPRTAESAVAFTAGAAISLGGVLGVTHVTDLGEEPPAKKPAVSQPDTRNIPKNTGPDIQDTPNMHIIDGIPDLKDFSTSFEIRPDGKPRFLNYFASDAPKDAKFIVNIVTAAEQLPALEQLLQSRKEADFFASDDYIKDTKVVDEHTTDIITDYFQQLEKITGIPVEIRQNMTMDENGYPPHLTVGGFTPSAVGEGIMGFSDFPPETRVATRTAIDQIPLMLNVKFLQKLRDKPDATKGLFAHEVGHFLGKRHNKEVDIEAEFMLPGNVSDEFNHQAAVMSYNDSTIPPPVGTTINSGNGPAEIFILRNALKKEGFPVPHIDGGQTFDLPEQGAQHLQEMKEYFPKGKSITRSLILMGGDEDNRLIGSSGSDVLVTETGYCGKIEHDQIVISKDGRLPYCVVEGGFSVVESSDGNDLIITAQGTEEKILLGNGKKEIAVSQSNIGNKTIVADEQTDHTTLTLHYSALGNAVKASESGDDIVLEFMDKHNNTIGNITLVGQAEQNSIDLLRIVDNDNKPMAEVKTQDITTASEMQNHLETAWKEAKQAFQTLSPAGQKPDRETLWREMLDKNGRRTTSNTNYNQPNGRHGHHHGERASASGRSELPDSWNGSYILKLEAAKRRDDQSPEHGGRG